MSRWVTLLAALALGAVLMYAYISNPVPGEAKTEPNVAARVIQEVVTAATTTAKKMQDIVKIETGWKEGVATVFWVGEESGPDNDYIANDQSAWDEEWEQHFGGVDDPDRRCGSEPCAFVPKQNPFYVALPYNDLDDEGVRKANAMRIPWNRSDAKSSVLKNRWVAVRVGGKTCFGEWQDVGPFEEDDIEYVFGDAAKPKNMFGEKAGIDLSPAMRDCLGVGDVSEVEWRHVEAAAVPDGLWKKILTVK